ncbi:ABC transporter permease [Paenibacillus senegalensis]|uniref:ABC transporter permease n=1 Tax=Paenibacillus senegalensis TaxID=1465766 RepID=UPI000287CEF7|nr:ABC transporter permease [Paenibacillus senegalensis]
MIRQLIAAEFYKVRRKGFWFLTFLGPFGVVALQMVNYGVRKDYLLQISDDHWRDYLENVSSFTPLALILGIVILTSLLASVEDETNAWKQIMAFPVSKLSVYLAKMSMLLGFLFLSCILLTLWTWGYGVFLQLDGPIPYGLMLQHGFYPFFAALPVLALHLWLTTVSRNQGLPITIGIMGVVFAFMPYALPDWMIWKWPLLQNAWQEPLLNVGLGLIAGAALYLAGMLDFKRRDVK